MDLYINAEDNFTVEDVLDIIYKDYHPHITLRYAVGTRIAVQSDSHFWLVNLKRQLTGRTSYYFSSPTAIVV